MIAAEPCGLCGERSRVEVVLHLEMWRCLTCGYVTVPPLEQPSWRR